MKINEIILENQQLDELSMQQVGRGIGKGATALGKGIGATAAGTYQAGKQFFKGIKQGWQAGKSAVAGDEPAAGTSGAAGGTAGTSGAGGAAGGTAGTSGAGVGAGGAAGGTTGAGGAAGTSGAGAVGAGGAAGGTTGAGGAAGTSGAGGVTLTLDQVKQVIPKMRPRDLNTLKTLIDKLVTSKTGAAGGVGSGGTPPSGSVTPKKTRTKKNQTVTTPESIFYSKFLNMKI